MPINTQTITQNITAIKSATCDKCGHTIPVDVLEYDEIVHINFIGGYTSHWGDGTEVDIVLCDKCAYELLSPYKVTK